MIVTLDIETIPGPNRPSPESIKAPANYKDPAKIRAYQEEAVEDEWRKQALHPLQGRIVCIGYAVDDQPVRIIQTETEQVMLTLLSADLKTQLGHDLLTWVGHNVADFDLQWLRLRAIKYGLTWLQQNIRLDRYKGNYFDTMAEMGAWNQRYRLIDALEFFGLPSKPDGMDGSKVFDLWQAGEMDKITEYCRNDVEIERALALRLNPALRLSMAKTMDECPV